MKKKFIVEVEVHSSVTQRDLKQYIKNAIDYWGMQLRPPFALGKDDPGDRLFPSKHTKVSSCKERP